MSTISHRAALFPATAVEIAHSQAEDSATATGNSSSAAAPCRLSTYIVGWLLVIALMLVAEVAVCAVVGTAMNLVSKVYHEAELPRHSSDEAVASGFDQTETSSAVTHTSSINGDAKHGNQQIATDKIRLNCMQATHDCN
jgi:hypothetical protein